MSNPITEKKESKYERADRIARDIIQQERSYNRKKTARLRDLRLKAERMAAE